MEEKIRVLVVDDSEFQQGLITGILESDPDIEVVGHAKNGVEAIEKTLNLKPDVITMDVKMPIMDGMEATREIMVERPTPIVIVSVTVKEEQKFAFTCLKRGALDFVSINPEGGIVPSELISKVKTCSRIKVVTHPKGIKPRVGKPRPKKVERYEIVGIAVSTGGPVALEKVLSKIPENFPLPIVIVQHISEGFTAGLAEWLSEQCKLKVIEAKDKYELKPGYAYLAPCGYHLIVDEDERIKLLQEDFPGGYHKPSADVMLNSIADVYGAKAIGIIMTGMGKDGVAGIKAIREIGGFTIAQDEESSTIFGMNKVAIDEGSVVEVVPLSQIAGALIALVK